MLVVLGLASAVAHGVGLSPRQVEEISKVATAAL